MNANLPHFIRTYDGDLPPGVCQSLIALFHSLAAQQRENGKGIRAGLEDSRWTELNISQIADPALLGTLRQKITFGLGRYNRDVELAIPLPNSAKLDRLTMKRYQPGGDDRFQLHFDSLHQFSSRYLVLLWYLNDVAEGGETAFPQLDVKIAPKAGRLLMFPPYWMFQHAGLPPVSGDKYILSTYLLF